MKLVTFEDPSKRRRIGARTPSGEIYAAGGDFTVPPGYDNDTYYARFSSGEHVSVTPAGGEELLHIVVNLDGRPILDYITKASRNRQVLIAARSVI